jgi:hypothetical protein
LLYISPVVVFVNTFAATPSTFVSANQNHSNLYELSG